MGDIVEMTTVPNQQNVFYKITSGSLRFQVKGTNKAGIGLAEQPNTKCDLWIILSTGRATVLKGKRTLLTIAIRNNSILYDDEFRHFWLYWYDGKICLGRENSNEPFIACMEKTANLKYVTFSVYNDNGIPLQWRFELPPMLERIKIKPLFAGYLKWVPADNVLPDGALIGGHENEMLYIIRAEHQGSLTPGKFMASHGLGYIPWGGNSNEKNEFEVLCGYNCFWVPCSHGTVPAGAIEAGHTEGYVNEPLYVGRAHLHGHLIPGKVQPSHQVCYIPYEDREVAVKFYEVLVASESEVCANIQCHNPFPIYYHNILNAEHVPSSRNQIDVDDHDNGLE